MGMKKKLNIIFSSHCDKAHVRKVKRVGKILKGYKLLTR